MMLKDSECDFTAVLKVNLLCGDNLVVWFQKFTPTFFSEYV